MPWVKPLPTITPAASPTTTQKDVPDTTETCVQIKYNIILYNNGKRYKKTTKNFIKNLVRYHTHHKPIHRHTHAALTLLTVLSRVCV